jgi:hypothetical protein
VLLLADVNNAGTLALESALTGAGFNVTKVFPEYTWNGSNPSLSGFDAVVHLNGTTYRFPLPVSGQLALVDFVRNGGGFIGAQWNGYERVVNQQISMNDLVLQLWNSLGSNNSGGGSITWTTVLGQAGHPVLDGIPSSFTFTQDGHDAGNQVVYATDPSTVLMRSPAGGPAVLVREFEDGRVVNFSVAANYSGSSTLTNTTIQSLYVNAVNWACGGGGATNQPPTANAGADQTIDCVIGSATVTLSGSGSDPDGDPLTFIWSEGGNTIATGATAQVSLGIGTHTITLTVDDGKGGTASDQVVITIVPDTTPPVITLNGASSITLECGVNTYTEAGATAVDDCDGAVSVVRSGSVQDEPGTYTITYTATDASGNTATATRTVQVQDTIAPQIGLSLIATSLWPPDHTMRQVASVSATDLCDDNPSVNIAVSSNEPVNGTGDGDTAPDWEIVSFGNSRDVYVRAERKGNGTGRIYTITITATDGSGNSSSQTAQVTVPHSQSSGNGKGKK